jgi:hypothetical protein
MATDKPGAIVAQGAPSSLAVTAPAMAILLVLLGAVFLPEHVIQGSRGEFLLLTLFLGGGAAWLSGRAIASTWRPYRQAVLYSLLLACVVRFFHFALFEEELLSLGYFIVEAIFLLAIATLGFRAERAAQMATRYGWLYRQAGPFGWLAGERSPADAA